MKIFISWSGDRSKIAAQAFREWLPLVLHYAEPWLSATDIKAGDRWSVEISNQLQDSSFGIICLTRENLTDPWILFEAGAIAKSLSTGSVCPYLLDLDFKDISGPLAQFQSKKADRDSTLEVIQAINQKADNSIEVGKLNHLFDALWPEFEAKLSEASRQVVEILNPVRAEGEILEDLVSSIRGLEQRFQTIETAIAYLRIVRTPRLYSGERTPVLSKWSSLPVAIEINFVTEALTSFENGSIIPIAPESTSFINDVAKNIHLDPSEFNKSWFLEDPGRSDHTLSSKDCADIDAYFGNSDRILRLTDIPF